MQHQPDFTLQPDADPLPNPPQLHNPLSNRAGHRRLDTPQQKRTHDPHVLEPLPDNPLLDRLNVNRDVWQLRHGSLTLPQLSKTCSNRRFTRRRIPQITILEKDRPSLGKSVDIECCAHSNRERRHNQIPSGRRGSMRRVLAIAAVLIAIAVITSVETSSGRRAEGNQFAERWITAWNSHDSAKVVPLFTADVVYEDVAFGEINHGTEELKKFSGEFFLAVPDLNMQLAECSIEGNHGSIEWLMSGTDKGVFKTGKKFKVRGVSIITLDHGKISRNLDYYDSASIMKQVGLL